MSTLENSNTESPQALVGVAANGNVAGVGTDWDARWQSGDTPWEKGAPAPPLVDWLSRHTITGQVLVPGCGSGHDVRAISAAGANATGIDLSPSAVEHAAGFTPAGLESYSCHDLFALPPELTGVFDWVFEHTCFCAIDPARRSDYVAAVASALKPSGHLLAIFYLDPGHDDGPPFGVTRSELDTLFGSSFQLLEEYVPTVSYPGREGRELVRVMRRT